MGCFVVEEFLLTSVSCGLSAIADGLVNFGCPIHISGMAKARALKLCTKGDCIKSVQSDDKSPLKVRGFAHVTHFCMHNCGVRKNYQRHSVSCDTECRQWWTTVYGTYGASGLTKA